MRDLRDRPAGRRRSGGVWDHNRGITATGRVAERERSDACGDGVHRRLLAASVANPGGGGLSIIDGQCQASARAGRKTDQSDSIWLATLLRKGLIRGSFIPPAAIRVLRDLCRSRASLVRDRTRVIQRIEKVLEEGNVKLDVVASDLFGKSVRRILGRLAQRDTDTVAMAALALGRLGSKIPRWSPAL